MNLRSIAWNNLRRRKARAAFLLAGLLAGVATVVTLVALGGALTRAAEHQLESYGANILVTPRSESLALSYGGVSLGGVSVGAQDFPLHELTRIAEIRNAGNVAAIAPKLLGLVELQGEQVVLMGVSPEPEFGLKRWWQLDGRPLAHPDELVAGSVAAQRFGLAPGKQLELAGRSFTVSGVLQPTGSQDDELLLVELAVAQQLLSKPGLVTLAEVAALCAGCPIEEMVGQIAAVLPGQRVSAMQQVVKTRLHALAQFESFAYGVAVVVTLIGALVVFVTMMGAVNERTREIGIVRALGFRRSHVLGMILIEVISVSLLAGALGYLLGMGGAATLLPWLASGHPHLVWDPLLAGGAVALALAVGVLAALYPALHASRLDPSDALRTL